jgi:hypothetical protein
MIDINAKQGHFLFSNLIFVLKFENFEDQNFYAFNTIDQSHMPEYHLLSMKIQIVFKSMLKCFALSHSAIFANIPSID